MAKQKLTKRAHGNSRLNMIKLYHMKSLQNTLYAPEAPYHLLTPQHWSQQSDDREGTF